MGRNRLAGLKLAPGEQAGLAERSTDDRLGMTDKVEGQAELERLLVDLDELHNRLWAEARRSVLLVLQGMDASGKDGTVRRVLSGLNPQGCTVAAFKAPNDQELAHDYLWRVHALCPPRGKLAAFNRSHYEDVVAARVIGVIDDRRCQERYGHIRDFESMLVDEGTTVVKVFLHISKDEQKARLQSRLDDPAKRWKFNPEDLTMRKRWDEHQKLYERALTATSTKAAPWWIVPADRKWARNVAVAELLVRTLEAIDPQYPEPDPALVDIVVD